MTARCGSLGAAVVVLASLVAAPAAAAQLSDTAALSAAADPNHVAPNQATNICGRLTTGGLTPPSPANHTVFLRVYPYPYTGGGHVYFRGQESTDASGNYCFRDVAVVGNTLFVVTSNVDDLDPQSPPVFVSSGARVTEEFVPAKRKRLQATVIIGEGYPLRGLQAFWYHRREDQRHYRLIRTSTVGTDSGNAYLTATWRLLYPKRAYSVLWCVEVPGGFVDAGIGRPAERTCPREPFPAGTPLPGFD